MSALLAPIFWIGLYGLHFYHGYTSINTGVDPLQPGPTLTSSFRSTEAEHMLFALYATLFYLFSFAIYRYLAEHKAGHSIQHFEEEEDTDPKADRAHTSMQPHLGPTHSHPSLTACPPKALIALRLARNTLNAWEAPTPGVVEEYPECLGGPRDAWWQGMP